MPMLKKILTKRYPALTWTTIIFILLALPGSMLPSESHFIIPYFDKYIHISIFCVFVVLWSFYYAAKPDKKSRNIFFIIFITACLYGIAMEYVQKYFIPRRDFDVEDILADVIGSALGFIISVSILLIGKKQSRH
jgi:VanZ family protein